jgi:phenylalanyl-tRNA synthetase alpha subunit
MSNYINIEDPKEKELIAALEKRTDPDAVRIKRFLKMPDLSRTAESPLKEVVDRTLKVDVIKDLDIIKIPEIISAKILFDLFNMPPGHPARSKSDTYYVDDEHIILIEKDATHILTRRPNERVA